MTEHPRDGKPPSELAAERLRAELTDNAISQAQAAREIGISASALSQFLTGTYGGDNDTVANKTTVWLDGQARRRNAAHSLRADDAFIETDTAREILTSLHYIEGIAKPAMTMIAGGPGVGKSTALRQFAQSTANAWVIQVNKAASKPFPFLEVLCQKFGIASIGLGVPALIAQLTDRLSGTMGMLIVDEAHTLHPDTLEMLRVLHEEAGIDLALAGDMRLRRLVAYMAQVDSRVRRPVLIEHPTAGDVSALAVQFGVEDGKCHDEIFNISQRRGALRDVESTLRFAGTLCDQDRTPDLKQIKFAIQELKLEWRRAS